MADNLDNKILTSTIHGNGLLIRANFALAPGLEGKRPAVYIDTETPQREFYNLIGREAAELMQEILGIPGIDHRMCAITSHEIVIKKFDGESWDYLFRFVLGVIEKHHGTCTNVK